MSGEVKDVKRQSFLQELGGALFTGAAPLTASATTTSGAAAACSSTESTMPICLTKPMEPPDSHRLNAALGWLGLGDHQSALNELELVDPLMQSHPDVLAVRCDIYSTAKEWSAVAAVAWTLVNLIPDEPCAWIQRSFALHWLKRTQQALDLLLPAAEKFPKNPTIPYNLACYCAQLGNLEEARRWLYLSFEIGDALELKLAAVCDPDLAPLLAGASEI
jgi:predicted Zn-dependent protease